MLALRIPATKLLHHFLVNRVRTTRYGAEQTPARYDCCKQRDLDPAASKQILNGLQPEIVLILNVWECRNILAGVAQGLNKQRLLIFKDGNLGRC
jgi:hypothetical protein